MSPRWNFWLRRGTFFVLVAYWLALVAGTHVPQPPSLMGLEKHDKFLHTSAYAGLAFLVVLNVWWRGPLKATNLLAVFLAVAAFGGLDELTQPPFGRTADWLDWYADVCGTLIGLTLAAIVCWRLERFHTRNTDQ